MYFPFFSLHRWSKRSAVQPKLNGSAFPLVLRVKDPSHRVLHQLMHRAVQIQRGELAAGIQDPAPAPWSAPHRCPRR